MARHRALLLLQIVGASCLCGGAGWVAGAVGAEAAGDGCSDTAGKIGLSFVWGTIQEVPPQEKETRLET